MINNTDSSLLKAKLIDSIKILDYQKSLFPISEPAIDQIISQLEQLNPIKQPLEPKNYSYLTGSWELIYASNGTAVTRGIDFFGDLFKNLIEIEKVWQNLSIDEAGQINADNNAILSLSILGEYHISIEGYWKPQTNLQQAIVTFTDSSLRATEFLCQQDWTFPKLSISIMESLRREALWITPYLDEDLRIGRGATGNTFVFCR